MGTRTARRIGEAPAALLAVVAAVGVLATSPPEAGAQSPGVTVTVTPSTDLVDGAPVTVTVSGIPADGTAQVAQCPTTVDNLYEDCDQSESLLRDADATGTVTVTIRVDAVLLTPGSYSEEPGGPPPPPPPVETDCRRPDACVIGVVSDQLPGALAGTAALHFTPGGPLAPPPTATVTPDDQLHDTQTVTVAGSGFVWASEVSIAQCASNPTTEADCDPWGRAHVTSTDGSFTQDIETLAVIDTSPGGPVDCRRPGSCVLVVTHDTSTRGLTRAERVAVVPLGFDAAAELRPPTLTVTPDDDLVDGQVVSVEGHRYPRQPHLSVGLYQCPPDPIPETCRWVGDGLADDPVGLVDSFTAEVRLSAILTGYDEDGSPVEVDCRRGAEPCLLVAVPDGSRWTSARLTGAPLHFDPHARLLPPPRIRAHPSTGLPEEATVTVTGRNFIPGGSGEVTLCARGDEDDQACAPGVAPVTTDAEGEITVELRVSARFEAVDGTQVDCRVRPGCEVVAWDWALRPRRASARLCFAPLDGDSRPGGSGRRCPRR